MTKKEARERVEKLRETINRHRYNYHVLDRQEISDDALDSLKKELVDLETQFPDLVTPDSPSQRVGGKPLEAFKKITHHIRQWSFSDAFSEKDMRDFDDRVRRFLQSHLGGGIRDIEYVAELKIDGFKVVLTYEKGLLVSAATRGDGEIGEGVTENIKTVEAIPLKLEKPVDLVAEGEIWMSKKEFERLNKEQAKKKEPLYANPRNVAAGSIRQLDPSVPASRRLDNFVYDLSFLRGAMLPETQLEELDFLKKMGFKVNNYNKLCKNISEVFVFYKQWEKKKDKQPYGIDGLVIKVNRVGYQKMLDYTGKSPRFGVAFKFPAEQTTTKVLDITVQVGRTGALTPLAHFQPVLVAGSTVSRATLHNAEEIERLGLKIGDTVILQKAGDVIPDVVSVLKEMRTGKEKKFNMPKNCPVCGERTKKDSDGPIVRCVNSNCPSRTRRGLYYFASKSVFNIPGLGPKIIDAFLDNGLIEDASDFFDLTEGDIESLERFAEKSAQNLVASIQSRRKISFDRLIVSLGIIHVGMETAEALARKFKNVKDLEESNFEELSTVRDVGEAVAKSIEDWFKNKKNKKFLDKLLSKVDIEYPKKSQLLTGPLIGKTFVLTGTLSLMNRDEARAKIKSLGGEVNDAVSRKTNYLVSGENTGQKYKKARELGVKILNESEFLKLISG